MLVPSLFDQTVKVKSQFSVKLDHVTNNILRASDFSFLFFFTKNSTDIC